MSSPAVRPGRDSEPAAKEGHMRRRRRLRLVLLGMGAAILVAAGAFLLLLGLALVSARHDLLDGVSRLRAVEAEAHVSGGRSGLTQIYVRARSEAAAAEADLNR